MGSTERNLHSRIGRHTGNICKSVRNWLLFPFFWEGVKHDFIDLFPARWRVKAAQGETDALSEKFETRLREKAEAQGIDGDLAVEFVRDLSSQVRRCVCGQ